jgi:hypothetical protein
VLHLAGIHIPDEYHVDIQDLFKIKGGNERDGMGDLAKKLIDKSYKHMKKKFPKSGHKVWECKPLEKINLDYAAIDGYISYELYRRIKAIEENKK